VLVPVKLCVVNCATDRDVPALAAEFEAIGNDPEKFNAFLSRVA
jgi:hypothetical protein